MASSSSSCSGLTFKIHPLVIINISEHYTRVKAQALYDGNGASASASSSSSGDPTRVFGCVLGVQQGRVVEIFNSFELLFDPLTCTLDRAFLIKKQELYKKVFPNIYVVGWYSTGWYSTGSDAEMSDLLIHKALMDINESPIYLLLNPLINDAQKDLPLTIFESELHVIEGNPQLIFVRSNYTIETMGAERISVDHVAHMSPYGGDSAATQLAAHLAGMQSAVKMVNSRIEIVHQHIVSMQKGDIPFDNSLIRQLSSLLRRLPAMDSQKFQDDFLMEFNDTLLIMYLAMLTKCSSTMNDLVDKFNIMYKKSMRRGGQALFI